MYYLGQWFSTRAIWPPGDTGQRLETFLVVTTVGRDASASTGYRPGMLLSILQQTGCPHDKELSSPNCQWCRVLATAFAQKQGEDVNVSFPRNFKNEFQLSLWVWESEVNKLNWAA